MVTKSGELVLSDVSISLDPNEIYKMYEEISQFLGVPKLHEVFGHYCTEVDGRIVEFQKKFYLDDYDSESGNIPDYLFAELAERIGIPLDLSPEELIFILDRAKLVYWSSEGIKNSPLEGVW